MTCCILKPTYGGRPSLQVRALRLICRAAQAGATNTNVRADLDVTQTHATDITAALEAHGLVQRIPGQRPIRFVATARGRNEIAAHDAADAGGPKLVPVGQAIRTMGPKPGKMDPVITRALHGRDMVVPVRPSCDAPVTVFSDGRPAGKPIFASGTTVTRGIAAGYDPRYQCAPGEQPSGAGFAAAGIGRDITTGQGWGAR